MAEEQRDQGGGKEVRSVETLSETGGLLVMLGRGEGSRADAILCSRWGEGTEEFDTDGELQT